MADTLVRRGGGWADLWSTEDWIVVWSGLLLLGVCAAGLVLGLPKWKWAAGGGLATVFGGANLLKLAPVFAIFIVLGTAAMALLKRKPAQFLLGFPVLFLLAMASFFIAGNARVSGWGLENVLWALLFGLAIGNIFGVPEWLRAAANAELYVKIGLVMLGAELLLPTLLKAGAWGMLQAVLVVGVVWYACFFLARRFGLDDEFGAILATGVSVCGVSAAIAAGGALKGDPKKVSHTVSLILVVAVPMLVLEPIVARLLHLSPAVTGAWLGGTIDTTGAVVAAGTIAGTEALQLATVVKMAQNALIGIVAFLLAIWATARRKGGAADRPKPRELWSRFPKFILGFVAASLFFSLVLTEKTAASITAVTSGLRSWWFCLAFVSIGLETRVKDLVAMKGGRPAATFLGAQLVNVLWTLLIAALIFGGLLFPAPKL
jgi:uncharacterized integral membrane protein (TIGR00698 family)